jgi:hypothetical protein
LDSANTKLQELEQQIADAQNKVNEASGLKVAAEQALQAALAEVSRISGNPIPTPGLDPVVASRNLREQIAAYEKFLLDCQKAPLTDAQGNETTMIVKNILNQSEEILACFEEYPHP